MKKTVATRLVVLAILAAVLGFLALYRFLGVSYGSTDVSFQGNFFPVLSPPSSAHIFGTTSLGQDVFVRLIDGALSAALVLILGSVAALIFGILLAWISFAGGKFMDKLVSVLGDALYSIPSLLIALAALIGIPSYAVNRYWIVIGSTFLGVMLFFGAKFYRALRVNLVREQQEGYFHASKSIGLSRTKIFFRHLLPNAAQGLRPILTGAGSDAILTLAGLGFIGVGISATDGADWGYDLSRGINDLSLGVWWTTFFPALGISISVLSFYLLIERKKQK